MFTGFYNGVVRGDRIRGDPRITADGFYVYYDVNDSTVNINNNDAMIRDGARLSERCHTWFK